MEALLDTKSVPALLVAIVVLLCAHFLKGLIEFLWGLKKKDDQAHESTQKLILKEQQKINKSINNLFFAIKSLAGPVRWEKISKEIQSRNNIDS